MPIVQVEHPIRNFDAWKAPFDSDPAGRERSGVRRYQVLRPIDDPNYVIVDLEFASITEAKSFLAAMRVIWGEVDGKLIDGPRARIVEAVETKEYDSRSSR